MSKNAKFDQLLKRIEILHASKEQDYTGDAGPHFNFQFAEEFISHFSSRMDKPYAALIGTKLARLISLLNHEIVRPKNESIEDTFIDLSVYFLLWASRRCRTEHQGYPSLKDISQITAAAAVLQAPKIQSYTCRYCNSVFDTMVAIEQHNYVAHSGKPLSADIMYSPSGQGARDKFNTAVNAPDPDEDQSKF